MHIVYDERMVATTKSYSPSSRKPALVMQDWLQHHPKLPRIVSAPRPATVAQLHRAHDPDYVDGVLNCQLQNGFNNTDPDVARSLPWTVGGMITGARMAVDLKATVCVPVSGFHHAHWAHGGGFCTFNGLMVAALDVLADDLAEHVVIVDCDYHYGDGTEDILGHLDAETSKRISHFTAGSTFRRASDKPRWKDWLWNVRQYVRGLRLKLGAERVLVVYQAGADAHVDDPLGGFLTTNELAWRDGFVLRNLGGVYGPLVWNLAGGYQVEPDGSIPKVLEIHRNTLNEMISQ
jgi:acetoin utilization deacetylase AcuC-like enzyme